MTMRNQISGAITFDVSPLADAIAERLRQPATPVPTFTPLTSEDRFDLMIAAIERSETAATARKAAALMIGFLAERGVTLVSVPVPTEQPVDWFKRETD